MPGPQDQGGDAADATLAALVTQARAEYAAGRTSMAEMVARAALALAPGHAGARHVLAACRVAAGALAEAADELAAVLAAMPGSAEVRLDLAQVLALLGRHQEIVSLLEEAVAAQPGWVAALRPLAAAQWETGARDAAIATWRRLVGLQPQDGAAVAALGQALRQTGDRDGAKATLEQAVALLAAQPRDAAVPAPALAEARIGLAEVLIEIGLETPPGHEQVAEAVTLVQRARAEAPGSAALLLRCGALLHRASAYDSALECYAAALALDPGLHDARLYGAMLRLLQGDLAGGWPDYEARRYALSALGPVRTPPPMPWRVPVHLHGQTVRVALEQGAGDGFQFVRYLPMLAARGARVEVVAAGGSPLVPLLAAMPAVSAIVGQVDAVPAAAVTVPLLSLPLAFGTELDTVPAQVPYLAAPATRVAAWQARLAQDGDGRPRVGVAWWGNAAFVNDRQRSIPLTRFAAVLRRRNVAFHVLAPELREGEAVGELATVHDGIRDYADTAALTTLMDLVISVDTSVAHLAGALGRPVWLLLPYDPDWRWLLGRQDSPWYPTARLFRQPVRGDWESVLARVGEALDARFG